jgi:hypothetical protein
MEFLIKYPALAIALIAAVSSLLTGFMIAITNYFFNKWKDKYSYHLKIKHDAYLLFWRNLEAYVAANKLHTKPETLIQLDIELQCSYSDLLFLADSSLINNMLTMRKYPNDVSKQVELINLMRVYFDNKKLTPEQIKEFLSYKQ